MALSAAGQGLPVTQSGTITINDATFELGQHNPAPATPYPSVIGTSNLVGSLQKISVTLPNITHGSAADIDVLLVRTNDNRSVVLMSDAGLGSALSGVSITLDADATPNLPETGSITGGTYKPTDVDRGSDITPDNWPNATAPNSDLAGFIGSSPNAGWRLYVVDDNFSSAGSIAGWTIRLWTTPVYTKVPAAVTNNEDTQFSVEFEVNDSDTPLDQLSFSAVSANTNIIANSAFAFSGTGRTKTMTFTPKADQHTDGTNLIVTIRMSDGISKDGTAITTNLAVNIRPVNDVPTITLNTGTVTTRQGILTTNQVLYAVVSDVDDAAGDLTLFATSSNTNIVGNNHVFFVEGTSGTNWLAIAPRGAAVGTADLLINVTDNNKSTNSAALTVTIDPVPQAVFGNGNPVTISSGAANAVGAPYPLTVGVSNVFGLVGRVTVTLADLNHPRPEDLDVLLVGPDGESVVLMGQAGGDNPLTNARITFDDAAANDIPDSAAIAPVPANSPIVTYTYRPVDYTTGDLPSTAPAGPYGEELGVFEGTNPNGTWSLYVVDRVSGEAGSLNGGFTLTIYPAPVVNQLPATVTTDEDTPTPVSFSVADYDGSVTNVSAQVIDANGDPVNGFATINSVVPTSTNVTLTITPASNVYGTNNVRVTAMDNTGKFTGSATFSLRIRSVNDAPVVDTIARQTTYAGIPVEGIPFTVGDGAPNESPAGSLVVTASSGNTSLLPNSNIVIGGSGANRTVSLFPVGSTPGVVTVTISVRDTFSTPATTSTSFDLEVLGPASPLYLNRTAIVIQDSGVGNGWTNAEPYPSSIAVSNLVGDIQSVQVTILGLQHPTPDDVDILLQGPNGARVILMSDVGGTTAIENVQLLFRNGAPALPDDGPLVSGIFRPTNADGGDADSFGLSAGNISPDFSVFNNTDPNGTWSLYVADDTGNVKGATIAGGWMINFVTTPSLADIPNQETPEDTEKRVPIDLGDNQPGIPTTLVATSSNQALVANSGLTFEGSGDSRTLRIVPVQNAVGTVTITVVATIGGVQSQDTFQLRIIEVDDPPIIQNIANQSKPAGLIIGPIGFDVTDVETPNDPLTITVTATSSDQSILPDANLILGNVPGDPDRRTITITPNGNTTGRVTVTVTAVDNKNQKSAKSFTVEYTRNLSFANTGRIDIVDASGSAVGSASPYPSVVSVSGINGSVSKVSVTLLGLTHPFPDDISVLLVSPDNSRKAVLMANVGGGSPSNSLSGLTLTFDDSGTELVTGEERLGPGTYHPAYKTTAGFGDIPTPNGSFPGSAPARPYADNLATFNNISPNGDWKLFVIDDTFGDPGVIAGGWVLIIETAPTVLPIGNQTTQEDTQLVVPIFLSDEDTLPENLRSWAVSSDETLVNNTNLTVLPTNTISRLLTINPNPNRPMPGQAPTNTITVFVADNRVTNSRSFLLTVTPVDDPPVINTATNLVKINEDGQTNIVFQVWDIDSALNITNASVVSANTTLVPNSTNNLTIVGPTGNLAQGSTNAFTVAVKPAANRSGEAVLTFRFRDGTTTSTRDVTLAVQDVNDRPTITGLPASTNLVAGGTLRDIPFTVRDAETAARQLTVTATSNDQTKIPNANIIVGGADENRLLTITSVGATTGSVTITVRVSDGTLEATFALQVNITAPTAPSLVRANTSSITIRDNNTANPYPSVINIPAGTVQGPIHRVLVTLDGFNHPAPDDVDVLLVSPTGVKIPLMTDAGGAIAVVNGRLVFDANATASIPDNGPLVSGTYLPSSYSGEDTFPGVAAPYGGTLGDLAGTSAIGDWSLYVVDDTVDQAGTFAQGWSLTIFTAPVIVANVNTTNQDEDQEVTATITLRDVDNPTTVEGDLTLSFASSNPTLIPPSAPNVVATKGSGGIPAGLDYTLRILPATNQPLDSVRATNVLTVTVTRKDGARSSTTITNIVNPVNDAPIISRITQKTTDENRPLTFSFLVTDVDTRIQDLSILGGSSNPTLLPATNILFFNQTNFIGSLPSSEVQVTLVPAQGQTGSVDVTFTVDDTTPNNATVSTTFRLEVTTFNDPPTISAIPDIAIPSGQSTTNIAFTVEDQEGANVTLTATSSDQSLVRDASIVLSQAAAAPPGARTIRVTAETGVTGSATITVTATDPGGKTGTETFVVSVVESRERAYTNNRSIAINDNGPGTDYPSIINIDNLVGDVATIRVALNGFAHRFPQDVDILLVSPDNKKVLLLSDGGGGAAVTNVNLTFDQTATGAIPAGGPLTTGTYLPSNYDGASDAFPAPAPSAPHAVSLNEFIGSPAAGQWRLFVVDDTASDAGVITGGWTLYITTQPRIVGLANQTVVEDQTFRVPFSIVEESFTNPNFTFRTATTNAAVVSTNGLVITGSGTNYTVMGTPVENAAGETEITVFARNEFGQEASGKFKVTVTAENDAPFVTDVPDQTLFAGTRTAPIEFNYGDSETQARNLVVTIDSSNARLVPTNNVYVLGNFLVIAPVGGVTGTTDISIRVTDDGNPALTTSTTFTVNVLPALSPQYANPAAITIRDNTTAQPYPSTIEVSGVQGSVARVSVTLAELSHPYPADLDFLLVGPQGDKVVLMSDAGGSGRLELTRLTFDDRSTNVLPFNPSTPIPSGTYYPTNYQGNDAFASPAPAGPYATALNVFNGKDPNGTWSLYIVDDASPDPGTLVNGWILNIFTSAPGISQVVDQTTPENTPLVVNFRIDDADTPAANLITAASTTDPGLLPSLVITGTGNDRVLTITPRQDSSGQAAVTISVTDGTAIAQTTFNVAVQSVNQSPVITGLPTELITSTSRELTVAFQVTDRETTNPADITTSATILNTGLGTVQVTGNTVDRQLVFAPSGTEGSSFINVVASDGVNSTTNIVAINVVSPGVIVFSPIEKQTTTVGVPAVVPFTISNAQGTSLILSGSAAGTNLVDRVVVSGSGTNYTATVLLLAGRSGTDTITLTASDSLGQGSTTFELEVLPPSGPVLGPIADQRTPRNIAAQVRLDITDPDTPIASLIYTWSASNTNVIRNVTFGLSGTNVIATVNVVADALGTSGVTITVSDGSSSVNRVFLVEVYEPTNEPPVFAPIPDQSTTVNTPVVITLGITDVDTPLSSLVFGSRTSNPNLVSGVTVNTTTGSAVATVALVTNASGIGTVTITAFDGKTTVEQTFALSVTGTAVPVINPPTITQVGGVATITVTWTGGGQLETATSPVGPWTPTGNSTGTYSEPVSGIKFFRVRQ